MWIPGGAPVNIVLCLSHAIEEYDQLKLLSGLGYDVFSIGGYIDPAHPHTDSRPALPDVPFHPDLKAAVDALGTPDNLGAAQSRLPDAILEWADVIIYHHYLDRLFGQWDRIAAWKDDRHRVIWRSVGQSVEHNERQAAPFRAEGLERIAYSPKEANIPGYAGHDSLIRFYKDPDEWHGWTGDETVVVNITQHLAQRDPYTNYAFWDRATSGLDRLPLGPGSEAIGGAGSLSYDEMRGWLRRARAYLYTGTQPASYTLGLIEAMMTGIPVVSITPDFMRVFPYGPALFEGHELVGFGSAPVDSPNQVIENTRSMLSDLLRFEDSAQSQSRAMRRRAIETFGIDVIGPQWRSYLGTPSRAVPVAVGASA